MNQSFLRLMVICVLASVSLASLTQRACAQNLDEYRDRGLTIVHAAQAQPHYFRDDDGVIKGILVDYWNLWSRKMNIPVRFKAASWRESLEMVLNGEADINAGLAKTDDRLGLFEFSKPIYSIEAKLIVGGQSAVAMEKVFSDYRIGVIANSHTEKILNAQRSGVKVVEYDTPRQAIQAFSIGEVGALFMDMPTFFFNNHRREIPVVVTTSDAVFTHPLHAGVPKGRLDLMSVIEDGFSRMDASEREVIMNRWIISTGKESNWLDDWGTFLAFGGGLVIFFIYFKRRVIDNKRSSVGE